MSDTISFYDNETLDYVLTWINDLRLHLGIEPLKELPKAVRSDVNSCVVAKGINFDFALEYSSVMTNDIELAKRLAEFFDDEICDRIESGIGSYVVKDHITNTSQHYRYEISFSNRTIEQFIHDFDDGYYPSLDIDAAV